MLKEKILGMSKLRKRIFAGAMATALISTSINLGSLAVEAGSSKNGRTVVAFEELPDEILYQYLPIGSEEFEIDFPDELNVTVYSDETDEDEEETEETEESEERKERDENEDDSDDSSESVDSDEDEEDRDTEEREDREEREDEEGSGSDRESSTDGGNNDGGSGSNESGSDESGSDESDSHEDGDNPDSDPDDAGSQDEDSSDSSSGRSDNAGSAVDQGNSGSGTDTGSGETPLPETEETEESPEASAFTFASPFSPVKVYAAEPDEEEDEDVRELGQGEEKTLKGVIWKLNKEESQYSRFQAVRSGDVFVYEPLIKAFGLKSEVPLPRIRVTITEEDGSYELREKEEASEEASEETTEEATGETEEATEEPEEAVSENEAEEETVSENEAEETEETEESVSENEAEEESVSENEAEPEVFDQMMIVGGVRVRVEAPEGVFPAGSTLKVVRLSDSDEETAKEVISRSTAENGSSDSVDNTGDTGSTGNLDIILFDVTILDKDGNEIQPDTEKGLPRVTFENADIIDNYVDGENSGTNEGSGLSVYHFDNDLTSVEKLETEVNKGEKSVSAPTDHFSPLAVGAPITVTLSSPRNINETTITKVPEIIPLQYYTGEPVKPKLTITDTNSDVMAVLCEDVDYFITYANNTSEGNGILTVSGNGNYTGSFSKSFPIKMYNGVIIPLYDGSKSIKEWYPGKVTITASGNLVSDSATGNFRDSYEWTGNTTNVSKTLYFKYVEDPSKDYYGAVVAKTVGPVNFTTTKPTGKIKVLDKSFSKLQTKAKTYGYTNDSKKATITITATATSSKAGLDNIEYYISDKFYSSENDLEKAAKNKWEEYNSGSKPGLIEDKLNYSYGKITDKAGASYYVSTQGVWYDTIEPKVKSAKTTPEDKKVTVEVKGEDKQSGIAYYYVLAKKTTDAKPTKEAVKSGGTKADNGNVEVTGLTPKTQYKLYSVIEDKCGNLSDVKETKVTTKEETKADATTAGAGGGKNGAGGAGGSGGAGGTTDGKKKGDDKLGDSNSKKRGVGASSNEASEAETDDSSVKSRIPYIDDATEGILTGKENTSGWDKITGEVTSADTPSEIHIDMNGSTVVPSGALNAIKGKDETIYFDMGNDIIWVVNGLSIEDSAQKDIDFKVKTDTRNIPSKLINEIADVYPHKNLTLSHDGEFGFTAILCVGVGAENSGMYANLYYYNENEKQLEFVESSDVDGNGNSEFEFTHASDYTVILRGDALTEKTADMITNNTSDGVEQVNDADTLVPEKKNHLWLLIITLISLALCGFILFVPDKRKAAG